LREQFGDLILDKVGVLVFIDHEVAKAHLVLGQDVGRVRQWRHGWRARREGS